MNFRRGRDGACVPASAGCRSPRPPARVPGPRARVPVAAGSRPRRSSAAVVDQMRETIDGATEHDMVVADQPGMRLQLLARAAFDADADVGGIALARENVLARKCLGKAGGTRHEPCSRGNPPGDEPQLAHAGTLLG